MSEIKNLIVIVALIITTSVNAQSKINEQILIEGKYNGKNIFVRNTFGEGGVGYCVREVLVNGKTTKDKINGDLFMIDLNVLGLKIGESTTVSVVYGQNCTPRKKPLILNPGALISNNTNSSKEDAIVLEGGYNYQNLFIVNQMLPNGKSFGIKEIVINGKPFTGKLDLANIEIDLFPLKLNFNDKVKIELKYTKGYDPTIINPEALSN